MIYQEIFSYVLNDDNIEIERFMVKSFMDMKIKNLIKIHSICQK